ncbi:PepSY domain-containing protein [Heyndrickxia shackletonii]|uniref:PepSY domain-containing protein n=1 Tax=Heyndrickxia shackletonii TaxID=157838 RepID=UPI0006EC1488|nr:PepSY domain-containing protein [Heyndrickxia shackletonii]
MRKLLLSFCIFIPVSFNVFYTNGNAELAGQSTVKKNIISEKQAEDIALKRIKGDVLNVEMEKEEGKTYYEVKIITSNKVLFEVEIDAHTGKIVEVENEGKHSRKKDKKVK